MGILKIIEQFLDSLSKLFPDIKIRSGILIAVVIVIIFVVWLADNQFQILFFWYLNRKIEILRELKALSTDFTNEDLFKATGHQILQEIHDLKYFSISESIINYLDFILAFLGSEVFWKIVSGAFIGIVFVFISLYDIVFRDKKDSRSILIGAIFFGVFGGFIGFILPIVFNPLINYILNPLLQFIILLVFASKNNLNTTNTSEQ